MKCIYCADRRGDLQMSLEHIWPDALGGSAAPALFKSRDVCQSCNSLAGQWVDGAFLKSWFISHETGAAARQYMDPVNPGIAPITYMGTDQEFPVQQSEVCERWLGPAGEHGYHVHLEDDDKWYGFAGGDFIRRKRFDAGRAYLVLTSQNSYWALTALRSFAARFEGARRICVTRVEGLPADLALAYVNEKDVDRIEVSEMAWIRARPDDKQHQHRLSLRLDFSDRFLAKLSLGLGSNILGSKYVASPYADELRKLLWFRPGSGAEQPHVRGTNFWQQAQLSSVSQFTGWPGAWTIVLLGVKEGFAMNLVTPGGRGMVMSLSDDASYWSDPAFRSYREGCVYVAVPERNRFVGPVPLPMYLAHQLGNFVAPQLAALTAMRCDPALLPKPR